MSNKEQLRRIRDSKFYVEFQKLTSEEKMKRLKVVKSTGKLPQMM